MSTTDVSEFLQRTWNIGVCHVEGDTAVSNRRILVRVTVKGVIIVSKADANVCVGRVDGDSKGRTSVRKVTLVAYLRNMHLLRF